MSCEEDLHTVILDYVSFIVFIKCEELVSDPDTDTTLRSHMFKWIDRLTASYLQDVEECAGLRARFISLYATPTPSKVFRVTHTTCTIILTMFR